MRISQPINVNTKPSAKRLRWISLAIAVLTAATGAGLSVWPEVPLQAQENDPAIVVNLTSMVGQKAPSFTLKDEGGRQHAIAPGDGRKYVLIFHMGVV